MNSTKKSNTLRYALGAGLLLCTAMTASAASSIVTFQVDMSVAVTNSTFFPASGQTVSVRGNFGGWDASPLALTNNLSGLNTNLWSGTTNLPLNGSVIAYKYTIDQSGSPPSYESSHNRLLTLPATSGASISTPTPYYNDVPPDTTLPFPVTFRVDMAQQINVGIFIVGTSSAYTRGGFNGWAADLVMTNDPTILRTNQFGLVTSNVYVYTYDITGSPGQTVDYKFFFDPGANWESPTPGTGDPNDNNNRFVNLIGGPQTLPVIFFNDSPYAPVATNDTTFQVDMTAQVIKGAFDPATGTVEVRGNFNSWGTPVILCTNDLASPNTNLYKAVVRLTDGVGATEQYKFWSSVSENTGWETMADNRRMNIVSGTAQTLPAVYFSNLSPADLLPADTTVTFTVNMTNAVGTDLHVFDPALDFVYINGVPNGFAAWDNLLPQLTNNPVGSRLYSIDLLVPKGSPVQQTYKYGINGLDDEAPANANHVRFIRSVGTYVMPMDTFGNQLVEPSFGNLKATRSTPDHVLLSWTGRPGVSLQTRPSLSSGSWQNHPETDGLSATNWPIGSGSLFFRLVKPGVP